MLINIKKFLYLLQPVIQLHLLITEDQNHFM